MEELAGRCRVCRQDGLKLILSLGPTPLANRLLAANQLTEPEPSYALDLGLCERCSLVQIVDAPTPAELFDEYVYLSSYSDTMLRHSAALATRLMETRRLGPGSLVVEIGSNDGYLLRNYVQAGINVLGIEPARNIVRVANERHHVPTRQGYFTRPFAEQLASEGIACDVLHAHNVLAHVEDLPGVVAGMRRIIKPTGVGVIEVPYIRPLIDRTEFDTIYHEHRCYFSLASLDQLFGDGGLAILDVEQVELHGGSLRLIVAPRGAAEPGPRVSRLLEEEEAWGIRRHETYAAFRRGVSRLREQLVPLVKSLKARGHRLAAYGASAKGSTLLNYCRLGRRELDLVVDRNPNKQGKYTPGSRLPIHPPERLLEEMPDYVLLLTWNFRDEILRQQREYRRRGGRFIVPIPEPAIL